MADGLNRRATLAAIGALVALSLGAGTQPANGADPIRIGELSSYNKFATFSVPYRNGWQLAVSEINASGGIEGRPLEVISRDDGGTTGDAVRVAEELVTSENVAFIFGTFLSSTGLAVSDFANRRKVLFLATKPLSDAITMTSGNRYTFRIRPSIYMQTNMLVEAGKATSAKKWAIVAPSYEFGQAAATAFKSLMPAAVDGAEIVVEQYPALGKIDARATVTAIEQAKPDGIFVALFGSDLAKFAREGETRGLFKGRTVMSLLTGEPEWLLPLGEATPAGWIVTGYPWDQIEDEKHKTFVAAYQARYSDTPRLGSLLGYQTGYLIKAMLEKAATIETEALIAVLEGLKFDAVVDEAHIRPMDNQATIGAWVGKLAIEDGKGKMVDWTYADGADYMFSRAAVRAARRD